MTRPLTYTPAYLGLFAALLLALTCNIFLDIRYGHFAFEVGCWAALYAWSLYTGWRQRGVADERGRQAQKIVLLLGFALTFLLFLPLWGLPRAGLYLLAVLQAAQNCVTVTRRQLHFGLLVSAVMVTFAASHHRADWTMLFYLAPYVAAAVFTLVAEQINRRTHSIRQASLGNSGTAGQGLAIAAATGLILGLGGLLYLLTPQPNWLQLQSQYGLASPRYQAGEADISGRPHPSDGQGESGNATDGGAGGQAGEAADSSRPARAPWQDWPTPEQMRQAATRSGMPAWQADAIRQLADWSEALGNALAPLKRQLADLLDQLAQWLKENRNVALASLLGAILLMLALGLLALLREASIRAWLRTRFDYWYLVGLKRHATGTAGAIQFYRALERLFLVADLPRPATANTREFLHQAVRFRDEIRPAMREFTQLFELFRYGPPSPEPDRIDRLRDLYRMLYGSLRR